MIPTKLTRRVVFLGATAALSGCSAISALNASAQPLDTYDLSPAAGAKAGRRSTHTLLVARPEASATIATDRIMLKPNPISITYLPDARWSDEAPLLLQSLLIRSISATGRIGYVGSSDGGPVADTAILVRMDAFHVEILPDGQLLVVVDIALTVVNDQDQRVIGTRAFAQSAPAANDSPTIIVAAFQTALDTLLPEMVDWIVQRN
jgi:cholesterol transport system auxiliary component